MTQINRRVGKRDCVYRYNPFIYTFHRCITFSGTSPMKIASRWNLLTPESCSYDLSSKCFRSDFKIQKVPGYMKYPGTNFLTKIRGTTRFEHCACALLLHSYDLTHRLRADLLLFQPACSGVFPPFPLSNSALSR